MNMASIIREEHKGVYNVFRLPNGETKHELIDTIVTRWRIAIYNGNDEVISITKNDEPTRNYKVKCALGYAIKIRKTFIGSNLGANDLFKFFLDIDGYADYQFKFLNKIWDYCTLFD